MAEKILPETTSRVTFGELVQRLYADSYKPEAADMSDYLLLERDTVAAQRLTEPSSRSTQLDEAIAAWNKGSRFEAVQYVAERAHAYSFIAPDVSQVMMMCVDGIVLNGQMFSNKLLNRVPALHERIVEDLEKQIEDSLQQQKSIMVVTLMRQAVLVNAAHTKSDTQKSPDELISTYHILKRSLSDSFFRLRTPLVATIHSREEKKEEPLLNLDEAVELFYDHRHYYEAVLEIPSQFPNGYTLEDLERLKANKEATARASEAIESLTVIYPLIESHRQGNHAGIFMWMVEMGKLDKEFRSLYMRAALVLAQESRLYTSNERMQEKIEKTADERPLETTSLEEMILRFSDRVFNRALKYNAALFFDSGDDITKLRDELEGAISIYLRYFDVVTRDVDDSPSETE